MISSIASHLAALSLDEHCRMLILSGEGKHFSAGADLHWMKKSYNLSPEENYEESEKMAAMFEQLYQLPMPSIAVVQGAAFGGAVGLVACCDFAIASTKSTFCLSEVKLGILPAVILPYLSLKFNSGALRRLSLSGQTFCANEAKEYGLIDLCSPPEQLRPTLIKEINALLTGGPKAQRALKKLHQHLASTNYQQCPETSKAISTARSGSEAQQGFAAFFAKEKPSWIEELTDEFPIL